MVPSPSAHSGSTQADRLFDGESWHGASRLHWSGGRITLIEPAAGAPPPGCLVLPEGAVLAPGFIDLQVNGGGGVLLNDAPTPDAIRAIAGAHRRHGTTGLLPTLITDEAGRLRALAAVAAEAMAIPGVLGFHLEGPFLNPARKGIHPEAHVRAPGGDELALLEGFGALGRTLVTLAPECTPDDALARLAASGLILSAGHSEATAERLAQAEAAGVTGVTHLFNAMSQMSAREPGIVGRALGSDRLACGIICDGLHVDPHALRAAFRALGPDRLMLVTDAMPTAGSTLDGFALQGRRIRLVDGALRGPDGTLAGAHLTMIEAVAKAVALMGATLGEALVMASRTPARFMGFAGRGRLAEDQLADWTAFDPSTFRCLATCIGGEARLEGEDIV